MSNSDKWFSSNEVNYLISVSDIMMGLLYIFIIMMVSYALIVKQTQKQMTQAISHAQEAEFQSQKSIEETIAARQEAEQAKKQANKLENETLVALNRLRDSRITRTKMLKSLQSYIHQEGIEILVDENSGILRLPEGIVSFKHGESEFQDENSKKNLAKVADALEKIIPCYLSSYQSHNCNSTPSHYLEAIFIEGHTDTTGGDEVNWHLSAQRALKAFGFITNARPELKTYTNELGQPILSISGYGELRPLPRKKNMDDDTYHSINRRIDFRFIMAPPENYRIERNENGWSIERKETH